MGKRLLRSILVAAFSVLVTVGALGGLASEKGDARADTTWPMVVSKTASASDTTWPTVVAKTASPGDTTWPTVAMKPASADDTTWPMHTDGVRS
jgi:hypothetical protein